MKSLRTSSRNHGFTVIELILAIGILSILVGFGLVISLDFYRQEVLSAERDNVVSMLRRARNEAQNNINQSNHGVFFGSSAYTIFQGGSYAARNPDFDENFPKSSGITIGGLSEIVFNSLDGGSNVSGTISLSNGVKNVNIFANYEGRIDW